MPSSEPTQNIGQAPSLRGLEEGGHLVLEPLVLRMTPAMKAGVTDWLWSTEDIVGLVDDQDVRRLTKRRGKGFLHYPNKREARSGMSRVRQA
jgi:predicted chitinase